MKQKMISSMLLLMLLFVASCTKESDEADTLILSETSIELPQNASEKVVSINTNSSSWYSFSNVDWIETSENGSELTIKAKENLGVDARTAEVTVVAGTMGQKIKVSQVGATVQMVTFPDKLEVNQFAGNFRFEVETNSTRWSVKTDATWLHVRERRQAGVVELTVDENLSRDDRTAVLDFVVNDKTVQVFEVKQSGILYYAMPYLGFDTDERLFREFETRRGTELVDRPDGLFNDGYWDYMLKCPLYKLCRYFSYKGRMAQAYLFVNDVDLFMQELPNVIDRMKADGFVAVSDDVYRNEQKGVTARFYLHIESPFVVFDPIPVQKQAQPTFDKVPFGMAAQLDQALAADIAQYEAKNGGVYNDMQSNPDREGGAYYFYDVNDNDLYARVYWMNAENDNKMRETMLLFKGFDKFVYEYLGVHYATQELKDLLKSQGLEYIGFSAQNRAYSFYRHSDNLQLVVSLFGANEIESGVNTAAMNYLRLDAPLQFEGMKANGTTDKLLKSMRRQVLQVVGKKNRK